jgi:hypothetical protein
MKTKTWVTLLLVLTSFSVYKTNAQKNVIRQNLLWSSYAVKFKLNDSYQIRQEIDQRIFYNPWRQHQILSRTNVERQLGDGWNIALGFTGVLQSLPNNPEIKEYYNQKELRPQLELAFKQALSNKVVIAHRYWSEFRFYEQENSSYTYANARMRYKLELRYSPIKKITLKAFDELFINIGGQIERNFFDQNRIGTSFQFMPLKNFGFEIGYFNLFQQQKTGVDFYNRNSIKLTLHHTIVLKKNRT